MSLAEDRESKLAELLVDYERRLAGAAGGSTDGDGSTVQASADEQARLESAKACLQRLARIWPHEATPEIELPESIERFRIVRELGRGGFGIVYQAFDDRLGRNVALKVQRPEAMLSPQLRNRFLREAKAAARLEHPNIAGVYEVDETGWRIWIASEYVPGVSLAAWLRAHPLPGPHQAADLVRALAEAVDFANRHGVLHRDLKPSNVLLDPLQSGDDATSIAQFTPKLIDFGLAKLDEAARNETRSGALIGTPPYMAPEQAAGRTQLFGPTTDVYGLGTILYESLTGRAPFVGDSDVQTLRQVVEDDPTPPRRLRHDVPADLEAICLKCLEKEPGRRYTDAALLASDLRRFLAGQPTHARPLTHPERLLKWSRRRPALAALVAVSILAVATISAGTVAYVTQLRQATQRAERHQRDAEASAETARQQELWANRYLYAARMREGYSLMEQGSADEARALLEPYEPGSPLADLRGFEWYHLRRLTDGDQRVLRGHRGEVYAVDYSPDGAVIASGGQDGLVKLWDGATGRELASLAGHEACVNMVAFARDGKSLVSGSCDHTIRCWDVASGALLDTLEFHGDEVRALAISPSGQRVVSGGLGSTLVVWDFATRKPVTTLETKAQSFDFLAWRDDASVVFVAGSDVPGLEAVVLWNVNTGEQETIQQSVRSATVLPGGDILVGQADGQVSSVRPEPQQASPSIGHGWVARSFDYLPDRKWLAIGYDDGAVQVTTWPNDGFRHWLNKQSERVGSLAFSPRGTHLATAGFDGTVRIWDLRFEKLPRVEAPIFTSTAFDHRPNPAISPNMEYAALPTAKGQVEVFEIATGESLARLTPAPSVSALEFADDDPAMLYGITAESREIWTWNWRTGQTTYVAAVPPGKLLEASFTPGARHLLLRFADAPPCIMNVHTGEVWWTLPGGRPPSRFGLVCSDDGSCAWLGLEIGSLNVLQRLPPVLLDLTAQRTVDCGPHTVAAISKILTVTLEGDDSLTVTDRSTGAIRCKISEPHGRQFVAISPDSRTVATVDMAGVVRQWNVATGHAISRFATGEVGYASLCYSADGRSLALATLEPVEPNEQGIRGTWRIFVWRGTPEP